MLEYLMEINNHLFMIKVVDTQISVPNTQNKQMATLSNIMG